jgi:hypothetical protein
MNNISLEDKNREDCSINEKLNCLTRLVTDIQLEIRDLKTNIFTPLSEQCNIHNIDVTNIFTPLSEQCNIHNIDDIKAILYNACFPFWMPENKKKILTSDKMLEYEKGIFQKFDKSINGIRETVKQDIRGINRGNNV